MKKIFITLAVVLLTSIGATAQENNPGNKERGPRFSPEQFQAKQREYITTRAKLTPEEADAFFPIYFELQKEKFRIEREARTKVVKERGQKFTDSQLEELLNNNADARIAIAQMEKQYIAKYLKAVSPKKLLDIQRAENSFQSHMIKSMAREGKQQERPENRKR